MSLARTFEIRFRRLATARFGSLEAFMRATGTARNTVQGWTTKGRVPSGVHLVRLAEIFDVSVDFLLGRTEVPDMAHSCE